MTVEERVCHALNNGTCRFTFRKKDGSIRQAYGTSHTLELQKYNALPSGKGWSSPKVKTFFDLDKKEWRCFTKGTVIDLISEN